MMHKAPRQSACCGCCSFRTGSIIVAIIELIIDCFYFMSIFYYPCIYIGDITVNELKRDPTLMYQSVSIVLLSTVATIILLGGAIQGKHRLLVPWILVRGVYVIVGWVSTVDFRAQRLAYDEIHVYVALVIGCGFWLVVFGHYKELKIESFVRALEEERAKAKSASKEKGLAV